MNFEQIRAVFLHLSPQDGVRIIFNHPDYLNYFRMHNLPERLCANRSNNF